MNKKERKETIAVIASILEDRILNEADRIHKIINVIDRRVVQYKTLQEFDEVRSEAANNIQECGRCVGFTCAPIRCCFKMSKSACRLLFILTAVAGFTYIIFWIGKKFS